MCGAFVTCGTNTNIAKISSQKPYIESIWQIKSTENQKSYFLRYVSFSHPKFSIRTTNMLITFEFDIYTIHRAVLMFRIFILESVLSILTECEQFLIRSASLTFF